MILHVRLTVPTELVGPTLLTIESKPWTVNVVHLSNAVRPSGDIVEFDIAREACDELIDELHALGVGAQGGIVITEPVSTPFQSALDIEEAAPGESEDAILWGEVREQAWQGSVASLSFLFFLAMATTLAAIAVVTDQVVLVVGAMVVGPEFSAVAALCVGITLRSWDLAGRALRLLAIGFGIAIAWVTVLALTARFTGLVTVEMVSRPRPMTGFVWHPDIWSFIVALVAGTAGVLALTTNRTAVMVGVFISVTTVPAAGNLAVGLAFLDRNEIVGSLQQLGINILGMVLAGTIFLWLQRTLWARASALMDHVFKGTARQSMRRG